MYDRGIVLIFIDDYEYICLFISTNEFFFRKFLYNEDNENRYFLNKSRDWVAKDIIVQAEIGGCISTVFRTHFGEGPTSPYVTISAFHRHSSPENLPGLGLRC